MPPTSQHLIAFAALVVTGTVVVLYFECQGTARACIEGFLNHSVDVLLLSTGWTVIIVEGKNMFVEAWLEKRKKEGRRLLVEELRARIRSTGKPLTEQDLEELEQETSHILPTNSR